MSDTIKKVLWKDFNMVASERVENQLLNLLFGIDLCYSHIMVMRGPTSQWW